MNSPLTDAEGAARDRAASGTVASSFETTGIGLHSGQPATVRVMPAPEGHGLVFFRCDLPGQPAIPADHRRVVSTLLATTIGTDQATAATVEHLLAALVASRIDNARIELDGPEVPVLDGSAATWLELIEAAGREVQSTPAPRLVIRRTVEVIVGERRAALKPSEIFEVSVTIEFPHPLIGRQSLSLDLENGAFSREVAWARTFGFLGEVEALRQAGLALGGSLENAVVYGEDQVINPEGLRAPDEAVRHKALDIIGDLGLLGARLVGRVEATRPGHGITLALLKALLADPDAYDWE